MQFLRALKRIIVLQKKADGRTVNCMNRNVSVDLSADDVAFMSMSEMYTTGYASWTTLILAKKLRNRNFKLTSFPKGLDAGKNPNVAAKTSRARSIVFAIVFTLLKHLVPMLHEL